MAKGHNHDICIEDALARAEEVCLARGVRLTTIRKTVLEMIWRGHVAVKAYDLLALLAREGGSAKPPTIYRALAFLMNQGLVHKIESLNAFVGCPHPDDNHVSQFLICDACGLVQEMQSSAFEKAIASTAVDTAFQIHRQTVEIHGHCAECAVA